MRNVRTSTTRFAVIAGAIAASVTMTGLQPARAESPKTKAEIQATFDKAAKFLDNKDLDSLSKMTDPGATFTILNGKPITFEQWKIMTKKMFADMLESHSKIKVVAISDKGGEVVADVIETSRYEMASDKGHKYDELDKGKITVKKTADAWISTKFVFTSSKTTRDGKPLTPKVK